MRIQQVSRLAGMVGILLLAGCHAPEEQSRCVLLDSDFEQFTGWVQTQLVGLNDERAHSGRYSLRLPAGAEYGPKYTTRLDRCTQLPRHAQLSAWVYLPSGRIGATNIVVEVNCHGRRPNVWQGFDVEQVVKRFRKWEPLHWRVNLPADLEPTDELAVYIWHSEPGGDSIWVDDLQLVED